MNSMDEIAVDGYRIGLVSLGYCEPLLPDGKGSKEKVNGLALRDHGLAGGEIQMFLDPRNRAKNDPGYYYAAKCVVDPAKQEACHDTIGIIHLRRLACDGTRVGEDLQLELEALDEAHLLDRLIGETLIWHARDCGPGPFAVASAPVKKTAKKRAAKV